MKLFKFSAFVLGFVLLLQGVSPVSASESVQSYAAEDYLSARLQANITNHRILIVSELSETSTTWVNPDGTLTKVATIVEAVLPRAEGVYDFYVAGKRYVGQSNNIHRIILEHKRYWKKRGYDISDIQFTELPGSNSLSRRLLEQDRIEKFGLENLHNVINAVRR